MKKQIILASQSPRRSELLTSLGLKFTVHTSKFEEKETHIKPELLALHNAKGKAREVAKEYKNALIIGVDTVGAYKNHIIGKPKNDADALRILKILSGTTHVVISAICIIDTESGKSISQTQTTKVKMDKLSLTQMKAYIQSGEGKDKAGGYAIQGMGALFIKGIEGDYFNVVGLPILKLRKMLEKFGIKFDKF